MSSTDFSPTRMELQNVNNKLALARRGYEMLKKKRDTLIREQIKVKEKMEGLSLEIEKEKVLGVGVAREAYFEMGASDFRNTAFCSRKRIEVLTEWKKVIGVMVPSVDVKMTGEEGLSYSMVGTPHELDQVVEIFSSLSVKAVKLAGLEKKHAVLGEEIVRTRRKVNALEKVKIAEYLEKVKYIRDYLDEMEREDYSRLKHIKEFIKSEGEADVVS